MPEVSRTTYQFSTIAGNQKTMPILRVEILTIKEESGGMTVLHILIDPDKAHIVNAVKDSDLEKNGLKSFIRHHQEQEGRALARVIVKTGQPVKVIQAGEEGL